MNDVDDFELTDRDLAALLFMQAIVSAERTTRDIESQIDKAYKFVHLLERHKRLAKNESSSTK